MDFLRGRLVIRWSAPADRSCIQIRESQTIVTGNGDWLGGKSSTVKGRIKESPDASPVNWRPVRLEPCAPGPGHNEDTRMRITKPGERPSPINLVAVGPTLFKSHLLAPLNQAGTASTLQEFLC